MTPGRWWKWVTIFYAEFSCVHFFFLIRPNILLFTHLLILSGWLHVYVRLSSVFIVHASWFVVLLSCEMSVHNTLACLLWSPWNCMKSVWKTIKFNDWGQPFQLLNVFPCILFDSIRRTKYTLYKLNFDSKCTFVAHNALKVRKANNFLEEFQLATQVTISHS